jgi:hypothetical protein
MGRIFRRHQKFSVFHENENLLAIIHGGKSLIDPMEQIILKVQGSSKSLGVKNLRNFFSAFKKIILLVYISGCIENFTIR